MPLIPKKSVSNVKLPQKDIEVSKKTRLGHYFPNLHLHTGAGSIGDGFGVCEVWLDSLEKRGLDVTAVTDHGTLAAIPQFYTEGKKRGIRIIAGMEGYIIPEYDGYRVDSECNVTEDTGKGTKVFRHRFRHIVLLAMNEIGWKNLIKINNISWRNGYFRGRGRFDHKTLFDNNEGLICLSACIAGILSYPFTDFHYGDKEEFTTIEEARADAEEIARQFKRVFGDRFYVELLMFKAEVQKFVNKELYRLIKKFDLQPVITNDCHYPEPELSKYREMLREFKYKSTSTDATRENDADNAGKDFEYPDLHPRSVEEVKHAWRDGGHGENIPWDVIATGLKNTIHISNRCKFELDTSLKLPKFDVHSHPAWKKAKIDDVATATRSDNEKLFMHLVKLGYERETKNKWPNNIWKKLLDGTKQTTDDVYLKNVFSEYKVIRDANFIDYFLIVQDIVRYCMEERGRLYGQGRGSVAGSVISWFLGISRDDPLEHGLYFERFMNPGRVKGELPDIDMDFPPSIREDVKDYIAQKYGQDKVSNIGTISEIKIKSALQKVAAAHDYKIDGVEYDFRQIQIITHSIPGAIGGGVKIEDLEDAVAVCDRMEDNPFSAFYKKHTDWINNNVNLMVNHPHTYGRHAAGVIISPKSVDECIPIRIAEVGGGNMRPVSQWRDKDLLPLGFLKMDILGLRTLEEIEFVWKLVKRRHDIVLPAISKINMNDSEVYRKILRLGRTTGIFQLNSHVFQKFLKELKPRNYTQIYTTTALLRPGPMGVDAHKTYIKLQQGTVQPSYLHPLEKGALESTGGLVIFQEQAMRLCVDIAGFTLEEADTFRSVVGKKKRDKMPEQKAKFIAGAKKKGVKESIAEAIFGKIEAFAGYGFNLAHAVAYSDISMYQCWLKTHFPVEFWASKLQSGETNYEDKESVWVLRAIAMEEGCKFGEFSVNTCGHEIRIDKESKMYWRLDFVKGVGTGAAALIKKCAPYVNVDDLCEKTTKYFKKLKDTALKSGTKLSGNCPVGKSAVMALIAAGALDAIYEGRATRYQIAAEYLKRYYAKKWDMINGYAASGNTKDAKLTAAQIKDIAFLRTMGDSYRSIAFQHEVLRFSPRPYWKIFKDIKPDLKPGVVSSMLQRMTTGALVHTYGLLTSFEIKKYKGGKMIVGTVNEYDGPIRWVGFDDSLKKNKKAISNICVGDFVCVVGNVKDDNYRGGKQIIMNSIGHINPAEDEDIPF